jgi:hypothetical protein
MGVLVLGNGLPVQMKRIYTDAALFVCAEFSTSSSMYEVVSAKHMQYTGFQIKYNKKPVIFIGIGEQNGELHTIAMFEGQIAHPVLQHCQKFLSLIPHLIKCTRLDIQLTCETFHPEWMDKPPDEVKQYLD